MIVAEVIIFKGRGPVACVTIDAEVSPRGALRRVSDGVTWPVRAVERFAKFLDRPTLFVGEKIGLLLPWDADVKPGDVVEIVPATVTP